MLGPEGRPGDGKILAMLMDGADLRAGAYRVDVSSSSHVTGF